MKIHLGDYEVVEVTEIEIRVHIGHNVTIVIHPLIPLDVKLGDRIPLYTEINPCPPSQN